MAKNQDKPTDLFRQVAGDDSVQKMIQRVDEGFEEAVQGLLIDDPAGPLVSFAWVDEMALGGPTQRWAAVRHALMMTSFAQQALGTTSTWKIPSDVARAVEEQVAVGPEQREGVRDALHAAQSCVFNMDSAGDNAEEWRLYGTAECPASRLAGFLMALVLLNAWQMVWWAQDSTFSAAQLWAGFNDMR